MEHQMQHLHDPAEARTLALAIVDTLPEPFLVLDDELRVLVASRCFYEIFEENPKTVHGQSFFGLGGGHWNDPVLRSLLDMVVPQDTSIEGFELERYFKHLGKRTMVLNARRIQNQDGGSRTILLAIKDITPRRLIEQEKEQLLKHTEELLAQQKTLLREMRHRIANSLQIIASILLLKARSVASEETKNELQDAHQRVMSVAAVQSHLHASGGIEQIDIGAYLTKLTEGLAASMIGPNQKIDIAVQADEGTLPTSLAVSIGLIVTELIINALKYAFPKAHGGARIRVTFEKAGTNWKVTVADNGAGRRDTGAATISTGLGTAIISALAKQMDAQISEVSSPMGLSVEVTHAIFVSHLSRAA